MMLGRTKLWPILANDAGVLSISASGSVLPRAIKLSDADIRIRETRDQL